MIDESFILNILVEDFTIDSLIEEIKVAKETYGSRQNLQKMIASLIKQGLVTETDGTYIVNDYVCDNVMKDNAFYYTFPSVSNRPAEYRNPTSLDVRVQPKRKCVQNALAYALELYIGSSVKPDEIPECSNLFEGMDLIRKAGTVVGYAGTRGPEYIKSAIYTYGYAVIPFMLYENYDNGENGNIPDPSGNILGYHAAIFTGYDQNRFYFIPSWRGFGQTASISSRYMELASGTALFFVNHDMRDITIGNTIVTLQANCDAVFTIDNGDPIKAGKIVFNRYETHNFFAVSCGETEEMEMIKTVYLDSPDMNISFSFSPVKTNENMIHPREMVKHLNR